MKTIFYLITFVFFAIAIIFGGEYLYNANYADNSETTASQKKISNDADNKNVVKTNEAKITENANSTDQTNSIKTKDRTNKKVIIEKTPPHFSTGFDWSLPPNTQITKNSGLIAEEGHNPAVVNNRFVIVRWDESNPRKGQYDFSKLEATLKRIAPQQALIRLEVNSTCEAPKWALKSLRRTKHKSLIYWDKSYMDLTASYIQNFAKRFAANPQIIGVQLGLADGEFGEAANSCNDYDNKQGWGEFWMSPAERQEAENQFSFSPDVFTQATIANIDMYANAFGVHKNKLAFTNIGTLFTYGEGSDPYNQNLKVIAKYALDKGLGNRDGAIERWMSYTDKIYGSVFTAMPDGSCRLDVDEQYMRNLEGRYWGTENEFYGNKDYVIRDVGPVKNHPYQFMISSLRALQMRRNVMTISNMREINHVDYKTQEFLKYLMLTMGKQYQDTPDAFVLMGERYIAPYRLADQMDASCVNSQKDKVAVRSFGRWLTESPYNTQIENQPALKVQMLKSENYWYQGYYLPEGIDYEYSARSAKQFSFDLNDQLSQSRCKNGCNVEIKATFKDTVKTKLHIQVLEGVSSQIQTMGDNKTKTVTFTVQSELHKQLQGSVLGSDSKTDLILFSENKPIPLILMRINLLDSPVN
jgi:methionine-rich copper-binding protein CopC